MSDSEKLKQCREKCRAMKINLDYLKTQKVEAPSKHQACIEYLLHSADTFIEAARLLVDARHEAASEEEVGNGPD